MDPFLTPFFSTFEQKRRKGKGVGKERVQKVTKKSVFHYFSGSGFFVKIRGPGVGARAGFFRNRQTVFRGSSRTLGTGVHTLIYRVFPELFPQRDSSYNTHIFVILSHLDRKREPEPAQSGPWRPKNRGNLMEPAR